VLTNDIWTAQLCLISATTGFSLYAINLFPIHYFDLLYRCTVHLGSWKKVPVTRQNMGYFHESSIEFDPHRVRPLADGTVCVTAKGEYFQAQSHADYKSVAAEPDNEDQRRLLVSGVGRAMLIEVTF